MGSLSDLEGFLWTEEKSVERRLRDCVASGVFQKPFKIKVIFKGDGDRSWQTIDEQSGECIRPEGIRNLVESLEEGITKSLGTDPLGRLRIKGYEDGNSSVMPLDCSRQLRPEGGTPEIGDPWRIIKTLQSECAELRAHNRHLVDQLIASKTSSDTLAAEGVRQVAQLGSVRSVAAAAADSSSLGSIVMLVGLTVAWPVLRKSLDLPPGTTLTDVVKILQGRLELTLSDEPVRPPADATAPKELGAGEVTSAGDGKGEGFPDLEELLERLQNDPEYLNGLRERVKGDSKLMAMLLAS